MLLIQHIGTYGDTGQSCYHHDSTLYFVACFRTDVIWVTKYIFYCNYSNMGIILTLSIKYDVCVDEADPGFWKGGGLGFWEGMCAKLAVCLEK